MLHRFMQAGTPHFVITLEDSMAVGGHFYNMPTMGKTLRAMVTEHFFGDTVTNTAHPMSPIGLMKLLDSLLVIFDDDDSEDQVKEEMRNTIDRRAVCDLCLIIWHLGQLQPEIPQNDYDFNKVYWHNTAQFKVDCGRARKLVQKLIKLLSTEEFKEILETAENEFASMALEMAKRRGARGKDKFKKDPLVVHVEDALQQKEVVLRTRPSMRT